jgi:hypothetical protein
MIPLPTSRLLLPTSTGASILLVPPLTNTVAPLGFLHFIIPLVFRVTFITYKNFLNQFTFVNRIKTAEHNLLLCKCLRDKNKGRYNDQVRSIRPRTRIPTGARDFSSPKHPHRLWCQTDFLVNGYRGILHRGKAIETLGWPFTPIQCRSAVQTNEWSYTHTPPIHPVKAMPSRSVWVQLYL